MDLKKIIVVSGYPEVFKIIKESRRGLIVESLQTGKRMQVFLTQKISTLEDIAIFTEDGDIPLKDVFLKIYEKQNQQKAPDPKNLSPDELKNYFEQVLPEYNKNKVYISDMKKVLRWYNMLFEKGLIQELANEQNKQEEKNEQDKNSENNNQTNSENKNQQ